MNHKRNNSHNYAEIARIMRLKHRASNPEVSKVLKAEPTTQEDEIRVAKKLAEYQKPTRLYKGYKSKKKYVEATPESRKRIEIIHELGDEGKRIQAEEDRKWKQSKRKVMEDIVTPGTHQDRVAYYNLNNWTADEKYYYNAFNLLYNKGILKDGALNPVSYVSKRDPKYNYLTNGTHYKGVTMKEPLDTDRLFEYIKEIKMSQYKARHDIMNGHLERKLPENLEEDDLGTHGDDANLGFSTLWIEENVGTDHPDDEMRTEGLIDIGVAQGLAEDEGVQTAILYLSNLYAEDSDLSTPHLIDLNCVRFSTSVAQVTAEARRRNNRAKHERKIVGLNELDTLVNYTSEKVSAHANKYVRQLQTKYKDNFPKMIKKVNTNLKKSLSQLHSDSIIAREMIFINYGLILAALYKKVNNKRTKNERKN